MLALDLPMTAVDEDQALTDLCLDPDFAPHHASWLAAYGRYRAKSGNEFGLHKLEFPKALESKLEDLYKNRRNNPTFATLRKTRVKCCPMCGSPGTGHLDHHLPESKFREFAVLPANLVPACGHCNSGKKQAKGKGAAWPARFLHPYYDRYANKALWRVVVSDPIAVSFVPLPEPTLGPRLTRLIQFNLDNLLGWQFEMHLETYWTSLPAFIAKETPAGGVPAASAFDAAWLVLYFSSTTTEGLNGWKSALLRGIKDDPIIRAHLCAEAAALPTSV